MNGMMPKIPGQPIPQFNVDLSKCERLYCECGSKLFQNALMTFKVPALLSPIGKEMVANAPVLICLECKKELGLK